MTEKHQQVRDGILLFEGKISRNLMVDPMVSHTYFLEDGDQVILFDPSCGRSIGRRVEEDILRRRKASASWNKAFVIAGHSHLDHANNFYPADEVGAPETHVYVHETGFRNGKVMNDSAPSPSLPRTMVTHPPNPSRRRTRKNSTWEASSWRVGPWTTRLSCPRQATAPALCPFSGLRRRPCSSAMRTGPGIPSLLGVHCETVSRASKR